MDQSLKQSFRLKSFTIVNRQTKETKTNYWFWLKGPVDRCWTEILETVTTLSRLSLFSGEELELVNSTKIIFETPHIDNVNKLYCKNAALTKYHSNVEVMGLARPD